MSLSLQHFFTSLHHFLNFPSEFLFYFPSPFILFLYRIFFYFSPPFFVLPFRVFLLTFRVFTTLFIYLQCFLLPFNFLKLFLLSFGIFIVSFLIFKYRRKLNCNDSLLHKNFLKRISKASLGHVETILKLSLKINDWIIAEWFFRYLVCRLN